jgi:NAD(P) transhydrogenase subunit alpha
MIEGLLVSLFVFVLAVLLGFEVISKVPPILHTPLMSGSNAISGIVLIGALVVVVRSDTALGAALGIGAVALATVNVVGGFMVTDRMLQLFRRRQDGPS